ncbi:transcriptional regulator TetR family [Klebsiella pneumoniae]|uniref:Transcriptional regulator TetR family n=1 Tax=Klebsiella pneumoniae TaxID=573 RepID=A0A377V255_KLEPN|nr:transcriptional regulator TetR family [Klebsiella pneumoniae]
MRQPAGERSWWPFSEAIADAPSASEKLRRLFRALTEAGSELFFEDRKLYDIAAVAARD